MRFSEKDIAIIKKMVEVYPNELKTEDGWLKDARNSELRDYLKPRIQRAVFKSDYAHNKFKELFDKYNTQEDIGKIVKSNYCEIGRLIHTTYKSFTLQSLFNKDETKQLDQKIEFDIHNKKITYGYDVITNENIDLEKLKHTELELRIAEEFIGVSNDHLTILKIVPNTITYTYDFRARYFDVTYLCTKSTWQGKQNEMITKTMHLYSVIELSGISNINDKQKMEL